MDEINRLNERIELLEERLYALEDRRQIENLIGRFSQLQTSGLYREILDQLYTQREDRTFEEGFSGVYTDQTFPIFKMETYFRERYGMPVKEDERESLRGRLVVNALTSPVIEVRKDRESAVGTWITVGNETAVCRKGMPSGLPVIDTQEPDQDGDRAFAFWVFSKLSCEFIREEDTWKIWHLHLHELLRCPFHKDWISYSSEREEDDLAADAIIRFGGNPTHGKYPTTTYWQYRKDALPDIHPVPPTAEHIEFL